MKSIKISLDYKAYKGQLFSNRKNQSCFASETSKFLTRSSTTCWVWLTAPPGARLNKCCWTTHSSPKIQIYRVSTTICYFSYFFNSISLCKIGCWVWGTAKKLYYRDSILLPMHSWSHEQRIIDDDENVWISSGMHSIRSLSKIQITISGTCISIKCFPVALAPRGSPT